MSHWEAAGATDEWYTPKYIFDALGEQFDLDVAAPVNGPLHVPCDEFISADSLAKPWRGFVWMNPPFGGRNHIAAWLDKFFAHGQGIALMPDRTSAPWFQAASGRADAVLFLSPKVKFLRPDGTAGASPSTGTALMAAGKRAATALQRARSLGVVVHPLREEGKP